MDNRNVVVKISMPKWYADEFIQKTKDVYGDVRWLHIMFKDKMYNTLYNLHTNNGDMLFEIQKIRTEILNCIDSYYREMKRNR